jgi:hypothetical protein
VVLWWWLVGFLLWFWFVFGSFLLGLVVVFGFCFWLLCWACNRFYFLFYFLVVLQSNKFFCPFFFFTASLCAFIVVAFSHSIFLPLFTLAKQEQLNFYVVRQSRTHCIFFAPFFLFLFAPFFD